MKPSIKLYQSSFPFIIKQRRITASSNRKFVFKMPFKFNLAMSAALAAQLVHASGPFKFCSTNTCDTCPVQVLDAGTGWPNCVVYRTDDVFGGNDDFAGLGSESG